MSALAFTCSLQLDSMLSRMSRKFFVKVLCMICDWVLDVLFLWLFVVLVQHYESLVGDKFDDANFSKGKVISWNFLVYHSVFLWRGCD